MARIAEPWYNAEKKSYFAWVKGVRRRLLKGPKSPTNKAAARRELARILAEEDKAGVARADVLDLHSLLDRFLGMVHREKAHSTFGWYKRHLDSFGGRVGPIPCGELRPKHLDHWLDSDGSTWSDSTRRGAITAVKSATCWALKQGYLSANPLKDVKRPRMGRRASLPPSSVGAVLASAGDEAFEHLLVALLESGCRPDEAYRVEAADFDPKASTWTLRGKSTSITGKPRVVYLRAKLAQICAELALRNPSGPLFRNSKGRPWTRNAVRCRFRRRREALGPVKAYSLRHLFGTDAMVKRGLPVAVVAELMGHADLRMLGEVYGHVDERGDVLRDAVESIRGDGSRGSEAPSEAA